MDHRYEYNVICDVCGFKMKAADVRKRWDGLMVCDKDWEPRNILDFYRTRNDAHLLPFTRPDDAGNTVWTPDVISGITGSSSATYEYMYNSDITRLDFQIQIIPNSSGVITLNNAGIKLPTTHTYSALKGATVMGSKNGQRYALTASLTGGTTLTLTGSVSIPDTVLIRGSLTTTS